MNTQIKPWELAPKVVNNYMPVVVFVIDLKHDDDVLYQIDLDLSDPNQRKYLGKITAWALTQHYSVETMHKDDVNGK